MSIRSAGDLERWLKGKPIDWAQIVAVRAAIRALPLLALEKENWSRDYALVPIRAIFISWATRSVPAINMKAADAAAAIAARAVAKVAVTGAAAAFYAAADAADAAATDTTNVEAAKLAADAAAYAAFAAEYPAPTKDWGTYTFRSWINVEADCARLRDAKDSRSAARQLARQPIWMKSIPELIAAEWAEFSDFLLTIDQNYSVWIDWYDRRIRGERAAFEILGDRNRIEDKEILRQLSAATDENFWGKGHEYVNATLKNWLDEARERAAKSWPPPSARRSPEQTAEFLLKQASPQARITDGKLDAAPNATFDVPRYSDDLADLPSELLAITRVIIDSLPTNCSAIVRNCFSGFQDELLVRGNRPILNILKAMIASLTAELYGDQAADVPPDKRQLSDLREWGPGMDSIFASFFNGCHDLIHHYPLDFERENFIAATPIDEVAASGGALTEPIDAVAALIVDLGKQGHATENIVRLVEAHQLHTRDIGQLPSRDQSSDIVTPKRRHVLQTVGFYLHTYSVLASTKELWPVFVVLAERLKVSINALLAFLKP